MQGEWPITAGVCWLRRGGLIAHATEGVFGIACNPRDHSAVARVVRVKRRSAHKGLLLIADGIDALRGWLAQPNAHLEALLCADGPATTWIVPAASEVSNLITGGRRTVAVRVTHHPQAAALCRRFAGALVSTSANLSGQAPALNATEARLRLGARVDWVMPGRIGSTTGPSMIRDSRTGEVIRPGPIAK